MAIKRILVTGGAGYIGSHFVAASLARGYGIAVVDDLSEGHEAALPLGIEPFRIDLSQPSAVTELQDQVFNKPIDAVVHFAGKINVAEASTDPDKYFRNNFDGTKHVLEAMQRAGTKKIVFSSTAAVYGEKNAANSLKETDALLPSNAYGQSKLKSEQLIAEYEKQYGFQSVILRYFNASGAGTGNGEAHNPETHLIPLILRAVLSPTPEIKIFGADWPTKDGTCIRDYIHVLDLADGHLKALDYLAESKSGIFNLGTGKGHSVKEIIDMCEQVTGQKVICQNEVRRDGDVAFLVADANKARQQLGWQPRFGLEEIIASAYEWHKSDKYKQRVRN